MDELDVHALNLGKIVGNLLSLELLLRAAIALADESKAFIWPFTDLKPCDMIKSDPITNYHSLGPTIEKFNSLVPRADRLDQFKIVHLRDALAHGRISSQQPKLPLTLIKFGRPRNGMVPVEAVITMTQKWFDEQKAVTVQAIEKVNRVIERLQKN